MFVKQRRNSQRVHRIRLIFLAICLCLPATLVRGDWESFAFEAMGTEVSGELFHEKSVVRADAILAVKAEMLRLEALMSHYRAESDVGRINRAAAKQPVKVAPELVQLLLRAQDFSRLSSGAFDVTVGSIGRFYDLPNSKMPSAKAFELARGKVNYRQILLDELANTVALGQSDMALDLGGIGKGYAVDQCIALLAASGITQAAISAGGDTRLLGGRGLRPWWIGIKHPRLADKNALVLPLENSAISTSGDYERFFMAEAGPVHHILTPATGLPTTALASVSVLHAESTVADALATTVFVMGPEAGLALINRLPAADAILIDRTGKVFYSEGLSRLGAGEQAISLAMPPLQASGAQ